MNTSQPRNSLCQYLETKYDAETTQLSQKYARTLHKLARCSNHLEFNIRCSKAGLLPKYLRIKPPIRT